jgi:hypothetical protein
MTADVRAALRTLPPVGENRSGPLGPGLLASGQLGEIICRLQVGLADPTRSEPNPATLDRSGANRPVRPSWGPSSGSMLTADVAPEQPIPTSNAARKRIDRRRQPKAARSGLMRRRAYHQVQAVSATNAP